MSTIADRAESLLSHRKPFGLPPEKVCDWVVATPTHEQHILRMMVRAPGGDLKIPAELGWLEPTIHLTEAAQAADGIECKFVYVTVRHGIVKTRTDDTWHVDGFSMRTPHIPEQNYVWTSNLGTEHLDQNINIPEGFDPMKHNIHLYFQDVADDRNIKVLDTNTLWRIDPYVVHRRPQVPHNTWRTFFRISYIPIEIEDDTCMVNPLIPREKPYGRVDIRRTLQRYV